MKLRESRQDGTVSVSVFLFPPPPSKILYGKQCTVLTGTYVSFESNKSSLLILYESIYIYIYLLNSYDLKWYFARRQAVPVAELHGAQSERLLDPDIMRGGIRRGFAAKIRRDRGQATVGIVESVLGVGASKSGNGRPICGQHEGIERSGYHGRGGVKRSGQVHRCVSTSCERDVECESAAVQRPRYAAALQKTRSSRQSCRFKERRTPLLCVYPALRLFPAYRNAPI